MGELSTEQKLQLAIEAENLLKEGSLFNMAVTLITRDHINVLMETMVGSPESQDAHAGLKALKDIKARLSVYANEKRILEREAKKRR